jgi:hypothetical protein
MAHLGPNGLARLWNEKEPGVFFELNGLPAEEVARVDPILDRAFQLVRKVDLEASMAAETVQPFYQVTTVPAFDVLPMAPFEAPMKNGGTAKGDRETQVFAVTKTQRAGKIQLTLGELSSETLGRILPSAAEALAELAVDRHPLVYNYPLVRERAVTEKTTEILKELVVYSKSKKAPLPEIKDLETALRFSQNRLVALDNFMARKDVTAPVTSLAPVKPNATLRSHRRSFEPQLAAPLLIPFDIH